MRRLRCPARLPAPSTKPPVPVRPFLPREVEAPSGPPARLFGNCRTTMCCEYCWPNFGDYVFARPICVGAITYSVVDEAAALGIERRTRVAHPRGKSVADGFVERRWHSGAPMAANRRYWSETTTKPASMSGSRPVKRRADGRIRLSRGFRASATAYAAYSSDVVGP